jgi:hypothetical protein
MADQMLRLAAAVAVAVHMQRFQILRFQVAV